MAEDWRDALDVLLVFAGLFSAVVTTFVSQTSQKLQRDFTEITAYKMDEVAALLRVAIAGNDITTIPPSSLSVSSKFVPERSTLWVNGLWFTSLALSLTTALLAVLTKQWIHQYMSVPSGTPRDRSRIRHYRFMSLETWHVPLIIGLLPVLMHVSLGIFFAGLVVYLRNLDTMMSSVINGITVLCFVAYFGTNLLPLLKPDCPYKTPLTLYSYNISMFIWTCFKRSRAGLSHGKGAIVAGTASESLVSLRDVEKEKVLQNAHLIDARCLSWLHNISSNSSVQRIVIQALSDLPLRSVDTINKNVPTCAQSIQGMLISSDNATPDRHTTHERLTRAWIRFHVHKDLPRTRQEHPDPLSTAVLVTREHRKEAVDFLRAQIINPSVKLDALSWAIILRNALRRGTDWLDIHDPQSLVWQKLVEWILPKHSCSIDTNCDNHIGILVFTYVQVQRVIPGNSIDCTLSILDLPGVEAPVNFLWAMSSFMLPSFSDILWTLSYPSSARSPGYSTIPPDIRLHLDLLQTSHVLKGFNVSLIPGTALPMLIENIQGYVGIVSSSGNGMIHKHPTFALAAFHAVCNVVSTDEFTCGYLTLSEQRDILHILFRLLVMDTSLHSAFATWLSPSMAKTIVDVAFAEPQHTSSPLITDVLEYMASSQSNHLVSEVYAALRRRAWIDELQVVLFSPLVVDIGCEEELYERAFPFMSSAYVHGLSVLKVCDLAVYQATVDYITRPHNLLKLATVILMADVDRRQKIRQLAITVGQETWRSCCNELQAYLQTSLARRVFDHHAEFMQSEHPFNFDLKLSYGMFTDLADLVISTAHPSTEASNVCVKNSNTVSGWKLCWPGTRKAMKDDVAKVAI